MELNKFKEGREERPEDNWIRFLRARRKEEVEKLSRFEKEIEEARKELEYITSTPELRELYEQREKALRDKISFALAEKEEALEEMERIRKEGIEKGIKEKQKEIILNMNKRKMKIEDICEIVNLEKDEIIKIIEE